MRGLSNFHIKKASLGKVIFCILFLQLLVNYLQETKVKISTDNLDVKADVYIRSLNALSDEKAQALYAPSDKHTIGLQTSRSEERIGSLMHEVMKAMDVSSDEEKIETLYQMANILLDQTREPQFNLKAILYHLRVLRTRKFSKTPRPDTCNGCMAYNFKNMINPKHICQGEEDIMLFIIITTIPKEHKERAAVRETWASLTANNTAGVRHLFLFGGGYSEEDQIIIDKESSKHKDILQEDFLDNYYNLSYKAIMGYRWVTSNCPGAKYIMRTACDNFIHIPLVLELLQKENQTIRGHPMDYAQIGTKVEDLRILRHPRRKWFITANELNLKWKKYYTYCIGTAFVYHRKAAIAFLNASANVPFFVIEDAYIGIVMKTIDMPVANVPGFTRDAFQVGLPRRRGCPNKGKWHSIHLATPDIIYKLWKSCEKKWKLPKHLS